MNQAISLKCVDSCGRNSFPSPRPFSEEGGTVKDKKKEGGEKSLVGFLTGDGVVLVVCTKWKWVEAPVRAKELKNQNRIKKGGQPRFRARRRSHAIRWVIEAVKTGGPSLSEAETWVATDVV